MTFKVSLTTAQMQTLSGILELGVKALGLRSQQQDFRDLFDAIERAEQVQGATLSDIRTPPYPYPGSEQAEVS